MDPANRLSPLSPPCSICRLWLLFAVVCLVSAAGLGQGSRVQSDELVPIEFTMRRGGTIEIPSISRRGNVYLPLRKMFDFLRIKNEIDQRGNITGFLATPDTTYEVRPDEGFARVGKRTDRFSPEELIRHDGDFYFVPDFYKRVFALPVQYQPRRVAAIMETRRDLPFFLDNRLARLERRLAQREESVEPQIVFPRQYPLLDGFRLDWSLSQSLSDERRPSRSFSGRSGIFVLGGDLTSRYNIRLSPEAKIVNSRHLWRYVPPSDNLFQQVLVGDFVSQGLLTREMYGVRITSIPPFNRIWFADQHIVGTGFADRKAYLFSETTISGVSDAVPDGSYAFDAPLRYGANLLNIKSYSIWGDEYQDSYRVLVPSTLVPPGSIDYDMSIGRFRETSFPWHGAFSTFWGATRYITVGSRVEYFGIESLERRVVPTVAGTARLTPHVVGEVSYSPNTIGNASLTAEFPWLLSLDASFTAYKEVRLFNPRNAINEFRFTGSYPFSVNGVRLGLASTFVQTVLHPLRERVWIGSVESSIGFFNPRISHFLAWSKSYQDGSTIISTRASQLATRFRLPRELHLSIASQYNHLDNEFVDLRVGLILRPVDKLTAQFQYNRNFQFQSTTVRVEVQYLFPFARAIAGATSSSRGGIVYNQRVSGFVGVVPSTGDILYDYRSRTSFGGFFIRPFLDANNNGFRDADEEQVVTAAPKMVISQGSLSGTISRMDGLWGNPNAPAYRQLTLSLDQRTLDDPLWKPRYESFGIIPEAGRYHVVDFPIIVGGIIQGSVLLKVDETDEEGSPVSGARVRLTEVRNGDVTGRAYTPYERIAETFSTGQFEFAGVPPGEYVLSLDMAQVIGAGYVVSQPRKSVVVQSTREGDIVEAVTFTLTVRQ